MSTITAILTPSPDGTLHLPLPAEWRHQAIWVRADLEPVTETPAAESLKGFGCLQGKISMAPDFDEPLEDFSPYQSGIVILSTGC